MDYEELESNWMMALAEVKAKDKRIAELEAQLETANAKVVTWQAVKEANAQVCKERDELQAQLTESKATCDDLYKEYQDIAANLNAELERRGE